MCGGRWVLVPGPAWAWTVVEIALLYCCIKISVPWDFSALAAKATAALRAPGQSDLALSAAGFAAFLIPGAPLAVLSGFSRRPRLPPRPLDALCAIPSVFVAPAVVEEVFFRVLLLPPPQQTTAWDLGVWLPLLAFLAYHLDVLHKHRAVFADVVFLALAGWLGIICTAVYLASGTVWPAVLVHFAAVWCWLFLLGGAEKLEAADPRIKAAAH
eukprot:TRINITY_DN3748_c0_g3_i1.p2 TRINITY_DN3748_c0_g3~~TRINITY_DN3748_c0_g3_i1.p2  ORF type:complete len:247 (+),score=86.08 TRINITY_DN3748_c0_g3_i1:103-741(+)